MTALSRSAHPRRIAALLLAVLALAGAAGPVAATSHAQDTSAIANNTRDGSSLFRLAFAIRAVTGDVIKTQNAAIAYSSCTSCQTVAISIQILLVMGTPSVIAPTNVAIAINQNCTLCQTLASAYQFVVALGTRIQLTPEGRREIRRIRRALMAMGAAGLSIAEIQSRTDALMQELARVLATQIVAVKPEDFQGQDGQGQDTQTTPPAPGDTTGTTPPETGPSTTTTGPSDTGTQPTPPPPDQSTTPTQTTTTP